MILEKLVVGMLQTNCYLLANSSSRQAAVIDPGGDSKRIIGLINQHQLQLTAILLTHGHFDHILDAWTLKENLGAKIFLHAKDEPIIHDSSVGLAALSAISNKSAQGSIDTWLHDGDHITVGSIHIDVLETPGHTPGHVAFHLPNENMIFVGDTLFAGSVGRTDFPGGSYQQLMQSVKEKIFPLADATIVYPGHGPETTVGKEKASNPFFK